MNNFAGIISYRPGAETGNYQTLLQRRFPKRMDGTTAIAAPQMQAWGRFEASALNAQLPGRTLFLDGEIFNEAEIARLAGAEHATDRNVATLLHRLILAKGIGALKDVNGQFLIIYADAVSNTIHLLSDHSGVQQVFYHAGADFFLFASDIKFLLAHPQCPCAIDWESSLRRPQPNIVLSSYRSYATWFKDISLLPEATDCSVHYQDGITTQRRFWNVLEAYTLPTPNDKRSAAEVAEEYIALLDDAVKIRSADCDRAYSFLSGGLDSSAVCALGAKHRPLESFSIINQTTCLEDTTSACHQLAKDLGFRNTQFLIPYHEITFNKTRWKQRIWRTESPVNHTDALTKNMLHYAIGQQPGSVPYVLTGTGSDQYNGGLVRWVAAEEATPDESAAAFLKRVQESELQHIIGRDEEGLWRMRGLIQRDYLAGLAAKKPERNYWMHYVQSALHVETYSLLWDELRAGSAHGRSVRFPFLDYRFAQFIASVPARLHGALFNDKPILRSPSQKILPEYITGKSKVPAFIPGYDFRPRLYEFLTTGTDSLLDEAFGAPGTPHPVIDTAGLRARVKVMKARPEMYEWQDIMHIINLGLMEQLAGKDELDLDFERNMDVPEAISFQDGAHAKAALRERLSIRPEEELLDKPLQFAPGCALMQDYRTGAFFLAKNNTLVYELDDEFATWKALLQAIDGRRSTRQLLDTLGESFETIREFFMLAFKEEILQTGMSVSAEKTEASSTPA